MQDTRNDNGPDPENGEGDSPESEKIIKEMINSRKILEGGNPEEYFKKYPELKEELIALFKCVEDFHGDRDESLRILDRLGEGGEVPEVLGDFRIIRKIGSGGMGTVYEGEQISLKRKVALKLLSSRSVSSDNAVKKFYREALAGGRQNHPGIVAIYAVGEHDGIYYIAQELVEGGYSLADWLGDQTKKKEITNRYYHDLTKIIAKTAEALEYAHAAEVIHRDLKPSNILLTPDRQPKVTDFGLAKVLDAPALTRTGDILGTPYYMSPEQASKSRAEVDKRSDVYSLGVTLYEGLTLTLPFMGDTSLEILNNILVREPKDPRKIRSGVPRDLSVICLKAMEKNPKHRYQSMKEMDEDLRRFMRGEVVHAKPAGYVLKGMKFVNRNPVLSVAIAAAIMILVSFIFYVALWSYPRLVSERNRTAAINRFLEDMFSSLHPDLDGKEVKVLTILNRAIEDIENAFHDEPQVEASIRTTIGSAYRALGMYKEAEPQYRRALNLLGDELGEENPETLTWKIQFVYLLLDLKKYDEAESVLEEMHDLPTRVMGKEHPQTLEYMNCKANLLYETGKVSQAETLHRKILEIRSRVLGELHEDTLFSMNNLGNTLSQQGRFDEAEVYYRRVLEARSKQLGEEHTLTLESMNNLAMLLTNLHKLDEAETLHEKLVEISTRVLGEEHPKTLGALNGLAIMFWNRNKLHEAEKTFMKVLKIQDRILGKEDKNRLTTLNNLAWCLFKQDKHAEAESIFRSLLGVQHRVLTDEHPNTLATMNGLARTLLSQHKMEEAALLFANVNEIASRTMEEMDYRRAVFKIQFGHCLAMQEKFSLAEEHILPGYEVLKERLGPAHPFTREALRYLVDLYEAWNIPEQAERFEKEKTLTDQDR
jgi:serine/threonine protein kinase/Tfp pilus assembly protein PilF